MAQPNIVYIHSHDTGRYVSPYGFALQTPKLQQFAEQGVVFRQCFTVNPTCSPSRAALATGTYPHQNGMLGLSHRGATLRDPSEHLASTLRDAGYRTAIAGFQHILMPEPDRTAELGYQENLRPLPEHGGDAGTRDRAVAFIGGHVASGDARPFFLDVGFGRTHRTGTPGTHVQWHNRDASPLGDPRYVRPPAPLPDTPTTRQDYADYGVCVAELDALMGAVIAAIDAAGLTDETLVIVTTDHGIAFPLAKCNLTDHGIGVMLMLRGPGGFMGGRVIDAMVTHLDLFPTCCELSGAAAPARLMGRSLVPLALGDVTALHDAVFAGVNYHAAYEPMRCIRTDRYKLVRRWALMDQPCFANYDHSPSKVELMEAGWDQVPQTAEALYDLMLDPNEGQNLIDSPAHAAVRDDLRARLHAWMEATQDPLLAGRVDPDPGHPYRCTDRYGVFPGAEQQTCDQAPA